MNVHRRGILQASAALIAGTVVPAWAADLVATPAQMRGPFYPLTLPLDQDNDLVSVSGRSSVAHGMITNITGQVLDEQGRAQAGVRVEIWQVNGYGRYHHASDDSARPIDPNFQGYGTAFTGADGAYRFRTIKPLAYPGRAPHIHFALTRKDFGTFSTQMYVAGAAENERDFLLSGIRDRKARASLIVALEPSPAFAGELAGEFPIVLSADGRLKRGALPEAYRLARIGLESKHE
ncbi:MAG: intradiol ring-cleavage dioxygenase [Prolixibacteraceae bacterium]|nr:intradiol ring-cleavage dioxygenase [Burkholderiales bacterium]